MQYRMLSRRPKENFQSINLKIKLNFYFYAVSIFFFPMSSVFFLSIKVPGCIHFWKHKSSALECTYCLSGETKLSGIISCRHYRPGKTHPHLYGEWHQLLLPDQNPAAVACQGAEKAGLCAAQKEIDVDDLPHTGRPQIHVTHATNPWHVAAWTEQVEGRVSHLAPVLGPVCTWRGSLHHWECTAASVQQGGTGPEQLGWTTRRAAEKVLLLLSFFLLPFASAFDQY